MSPASGRCLANGTMRIRDASRGVLATAGLCAVALIVAAVSGCAKRPAPPLAAAYADIDRLVKLHPGYPQLAAIEQWTLSERAAAKQTSPEVPAPTSHAFAPVRGADLQPPAVEAVLDRVKQVTSDEVERIAADLRSRVQIELARRTRDAVRQAQERIAGPRADILSQLGDARRWVLLDFRPQVENLRLQVTNLEVRLQFPRLLPDEAARAQAQLDSLRQELANATKAQAARLDAVQKQYGAQLAALERQASDEAGRDIAAARQRLQTEVEQEVARERERLMAPLAAAAQEMTLRLELPEVEPAVVGPGAMRQDMIAAVASPVAQASRLRWSRDMAGGARALALLRRNLADAIRRDTVLTAQTLARAHRWRLAFTRAPGEQDITQQAQQWLRAYWRG